MTLSSEVKVLIKAIFEQHTWSAQSMCNAYPKKGWVKSTVHRLIQKIQAGGGIERKPGSGHQRSKNTLQNNEEVITRSFSQDEPGTHESQR